MTSNLSDKLAVQHIIIHELADWAEYFEDEISRARTERREYLKAADEAENEDNYSRMNIAMDAAKRNGWEIMAYTEILNMIANYAAIQDK